MIYKLSVLYVQHMHKHELNIVTHFQAKQIFLLNCFAAGKLS